HKLLKYLLRGRYRSTPFGYWAGVGLGKWGSSYSLPDLETKPITTINSRSTLPEKSTPTRYCLPVGFKKNKSHYIFWSFDKAKEGWLSKFVETNKVVEMIIEWLQNNPFLELDSFISWFESSDNREINAIWEKLIE